MILKTYNNYTIKSNKSKNINIEKEFESDNYLIQTLKRTSKFKNDKKLSEYQKGLQELLIYIFKTIKFNNNPKIKPIHEENEEFLKPYKYLSKLFESQTEEILKDLIVKYTQRGYHIPKFSYKNNIFKINPLIEENSEKMRLMLIEDMRQKKNILGPKTMSFLNKLFYLVKILISKDQTSIKKYSKLLNKKEPVTSKESIEELKKDIENLINLTKKLKINKIGTTPVKRRSSYLSKTPYANNFKITNTKIESKDDLLSINKNINNDNINNNGILSTEDSSSGINNLKERNTLNFFSMRLTNIGQSNKIISSLYSINKINPSDNTENVKTENKINKKSFLIKKGKPIINLKMKSFFPKEKKSERIKTPKESDNEEEKAKHERKNTYSDLGKYITQAKGNKSFQSDKNNYFLGLKKNNPTIKRNDFLSQKNNNKFFVHSFDSIKYNYIKRKSEKKNTFSRNEKNSSELNEIKEGRTEKLKEYRSKFLWNAYRNIRKGKYEKVENFMRKYLNDIKDINSKEQEKIMNYYSYKNLKNNLLELNLKVNQDKTRRKVEKIYSNIHILKRITPALISLKEKENNIDRLEKLYTSGMNKYD